MQIIDRNAVLARLELIANVLMLSDEHIPDAEDDESIIGFACRFRQSLDWIFLGDVRGMIERCAK